MIGTTMTGTMAHGNAQRNSGNRSRVEQQLHEVHRAVARIGLDHAVQGRVALGRRQIRVRPRGQEPLQQRLVAQSRRIVECTHPFAVQLARICARVQQHLGHVPLRCVLHRAAQHQLAKRVERTSSILGLDALLRRKPGALSGGQRQRVALGRAIARDPAVYLFDEPLSNLDAALRAEVRVEIKKLHRELGATMVYVTHDQVEAMTLADKLVVLNGGLVEQAGPPLEVYERPASRFVAGFMGSPAMNFVRAKVEGGRATAPGLDLPAPAEARGEVIVGIRPHDVVEDTEGALVLEVEVAEDSEGERAVVSAH